MHIDLNDLQPGASAEILDRIPWRVLKVASKVAGKTDISDDETDKINDLTLKTMVRSWNVKNVEGQAVKIPSEASEDEIGMVDGMIIGKILSEIIKLTRSVKTDPNSGNASSMS